MQKILCWLGIHEWENYHLFLTKNYWRLVKWGKYPEFICFSCGKDKYKNTVEILEF